MRSARPRLVLRMELAAHEPRVVGQLHDLHELAVGRSARHAQTALLQRRHVLRVHLITMAVPLFDRIRRVRLAGERAVAQERRVLAEAHRAAEGVDADEIAQLVDDLVRRLVVELRRVRADHARYVARELDRRALHAEADAEVGDLALAGVADGGQLSFHAARAEAGADQDAVHRGELAVVALLLQRLGVDVDDAHLHVVRDAAVRERLVERLVRVAELHVLADEADAHLVLRVAQLADDLLPLRQRADFLVRQVELVEEDLVEALARERERHLVDELHVERGDHRVVLHVAEERDLLLHVLRDGVLGTAEEDVRLDADLAQFLHGVLRRLRLQLLARLDVGDEREVDVDRVAAADFEAELAEGFQEGERLDVAHRAADLDDDDGHAFRDVANALLDLVRDVGDDLHRLAEVVAAALFLDDAEVDPAGGEVVLARGAHGGEALVVAEVEVGLGAVVRDEDFAVLDRRHRAEVNVDVGIELLDGDSEAARLAQ